MVALTEPPGRDSMGTMIMHIRPEEKIMANNGTVAYVSKLPLCDFCKQNGINRPAEYDFKTDQGPWANGCELHHKKYRLHDTLGTGKGQKLEVRK